MRGYPYIEFTDRSVWRMSRREPSTRESIVKTALELFSRNPYAKVSVDEIASKAGVSKGAVFHYFGSKIELAEAALRKLLEEIEASINSITSAPISAEEKLDKLIDFTLELALRGRKYARALFFLTEVYNELKAHGKGGFAREVQARVKAKVSGLLKEAGIKNHEARAGIFLILVDGLIARCMFSPETLERRAVEELKRELTEVMLCR